MAPVATETNKQDTNDNLGLAELKAKATVQVEKRFNPFYSPSSGDDGDASYEYSQYKVHIDNNILNL